MLFISRVSSSYTARVVQLTFTNSRNKKSCPQQPW